MRALPASLAALLALGACSIETGDPDDGAVADLADRLLRDVTQGGATEVEIGHEIYDLRDLTLDSTLTPASCDAVDVRLQTLCGELTEARQANACWLTSAFYYAHAVPRCAVRLTTSSAGVDRMPRIYALDFTGLPLEGPEPLCGDGQLDTGEQCDDGNFELWDGCDSTCKTEEFTGCETVIEHWFARNDLATVDATTWQTRRSHVMVNDATALQPVTAATCDQAGRVGHDVCGELMAQMPFVGSCSPQWELHDVAGAPACSVRFEVYFDGRNPDRGVFTTALAGELAFTIR